MCYSRLPALADLSWNSVIAGDGGHMVEWVTNFVVQCCIERKEEKCFCYFGNAEENTSWLLQASAEENSKNLHASLHSIFLKCPVFCIKKQKQKQPNIYLASIPKDAVVLYARGRLTLVVKFRSWNDYKDKDLLGTVSGTQIKSDFRIFGKQLSLIHTKCLYGMRPDKISAWLLWYLFYLLVISRIPSVIFLNR